MRNNVLQVFIIGLVLIGISGSAQADPITNRITIYPNQVPDEEEPRGNIGDAPGGFGTSSWQGPAGGAGHKSNWHARYNADGDYLSALFPDDVADLRISDLASISYYTKRPSGTLSGRDWWIQIYTRPQNEGDWYHDRFINNYNDHTETSDWTQYSTGSGMTFNSNGLGGTGEMSLTAFKTDFGNELIEMISVQTDSGWNGFDGYMDGLEITLMNGNVGQVDFAAVPAPGTILLFGSGLLWFGRRKSTKKS